MLVVRRLESLLVRAVVPIWVHSCVPLVNVRSCRTLRVVLFRWHIDVKLPSDGKGFPLLALGNVLNAFGPEGGLRVIFFDA